MSNPQWVHHRRCNNRHVARMHKIDRTLYHRTKLDQERVLELVSLKHSFPLLEDGIEDRRQRVCCPLVQTRVGL